MNQPLNRDDLPIRGHRSKINLYDDDSYIPNLKETLEEVFKEIMIKNNKEK